MTKLVVQEAKEFTLWPEETILHLKIDEANVTEQDGRNGPWQKIEFKFTVLGVVAVGGGGNPADYEEAVGTHIWGRGFSANITSHPENRMRLWAEAILNVDLGIGYEVDTDHFVGRQVRGITTQYDKKAVDPATGKPFKGHQVDALLRPGTAQAQQQQPQQPQLQYGQQNGATQQQQPPPPQQDPWGPPQQPAPQPTAPPQDPWGGQSPWGGDEPPF